MSFSELGLQELEFMHDTTAATGRVINISNSLVSSFSFAFIFLCSLNILHDIYTQQILSAQHCLVSQHTIYYHTITGDF